MNEKIQKLISSKPGQLIRKFCGSVWFVVAYGVICAFCHTFDIIEPALILLSLMLAMSFVFCKSLITMIPFLTMLMFPITPDTFNINIGHIVSVSNFFSTFSVGFIVSGIFAVLLLGGSLIFNLVYYKNYRRLFKRGYLSVSMCIITGTLLLGGIGSKTFAWISVLTAFGIGFAYFIPYCIVLNCVDYDRKKTTEYFIWTLVTVSCVLCAAILREYFVNGFDFSNPKSFLHFGYGNGNSASTFIVMAIPATLYFVYKYKHGFAFLPIVLAEAATIFITFSRAAFLVAAFVTAAIMIALCFKKKEGRLSYLISFGALVSIALVIVIVKWGYVSKAFKVVSDSGEIMTTGRFALWKLGFEHWKHYPVFGMGFDFLPQVRDVTYTSFHNTLFTFLYCAGIFGFIAYIYHRYKTVRLVFSAKLTAERVFLTASVAALLLNSLLDVAMTSPMHIFYYAIMLALIELDVKKSREEADLPPLDPNSELKALKRLFKHNSQTPDAEQPSNPDHPVPDTPPDGE